MHVSEWSCSTKTKLQTKIWSHEQRKEVKLKYFFIAKDILRMGCFEFIVPVSLSFSCTIKRKYTFAFTPCNEIVDSFTVHKHLPLCHALRSWIIYSLFDVMVDVDSIWASQIVQCATLGRVFFCPKNLYSKNYHKYLIHGALMLCFISTQAAHISN